MQKLSQWMKDQGTALEVQMEILSQLEQWVQDETPPENTEESFAKEQQWIRWDHMMDGWLLLRWQDYQEKSGSMQN